MSGASLIEKLEAKLDRYEKQLIELNKFKEKIGGEYLRKVVNKESQCINHICFPSIQSLYNMTNIGISIRLGRDAPFD